MVALNFKTQFADDVEKRRKRQTIRAWRKDGRDPIPGTRLQFYTGMRTKACRKLGEADCICVRPIQITDKAVMIDGSLLNNSRIADLAHADGFADFTDMLKFFEKIHGLPFSGVLIQWN